MSGLGGMYEGPGGQKLYGDGKVVERTYMNTKQVMTKPVGELVDKCVDCGCDLEPGNTHELYLLQVGLCVGCHNERKANALHKGTANDPSASAGAR